MAQNVASLDQMRQAQARMQLLQQVQVAQAQAQVQAQVQAHVQAQVQAQAQAQALSQTQAQVQMITVLGGGGSLPIRMPGWTAADYNRRAIELASMSFPSHAFRACD